jgi:hypothetical protein
LFIVVMIDLSTGVKHITNVRDGQAHLINSLSDRLVRPIPESKHCILQIFLKWINLS